MSIILILRPLAWFGIVGAELKRVVSLGQFMMVDGTVRSEQVDIQQEDLHELAELCEELRPDSLYARYANKKVFRREEDFWATKEKAVRQHVKQMADKRIVKAVGLADKLDIPMIYAMDEKASLHISDRLVLDSGSEVTSRLVSSGYGRTWWHKPDAVCLMKWDSVRRSRLLPCC